MPIKDDDTNNDKINSHQCVASNKFPKYKSHQIIWFNTISKPSFCFASKSARCFSEQKILEEKIIMSYKMNALKLQKNP
jgi:hypothetical protein